MHGSDAGKVSSGSGTHPGSEPILDIVLDPPLPVAKVKVARGPGCRLAVIASCLSELSELA